MDLGVVAAKVKADSVDEGDPICIVGWQGKSQTKGCPLICKCVKGKVDGFSLRPGVTGDFVPVRLSLRGVLRVVDLTFELDWKECKKKQ
jgi:hypothetical protein